MVTNHLLNGMIPQVPSLPKSKKNKLLSHPHLTPLKFLLHPGGNHAETMEIMVKVRNP